MVRLTDRRLDWLRLAAGLPCAAPPPSPLPQGGRGSNVALGRYFAEVTGGHGAGSATYGVARLRVRCVRPARCAHDGPRCHDAGRASQLGASGKVLLYRLLPKRVLKSISGPRPVARPVSAGCHRPSCAQRAGLAGGGRMASKPDTSAPSTTLPPSVKSLAERSDCSPCPPGAGGWGGLPPGATRRHQTQSAICVTRVSVATR